MYVPRKYMYLDLGNEFGLQRIRDLAIVCPSSMALHISKSDSNKIDISVMFVHPYQINRFILRIHDISVGKKMTYRLQNS